MFFKGCNKARKVLLCCNRYLLISICKHLNVCYMPGHVWASLMAQMVRNLPAMPKTQVQSLGWEDPLEKGMAIHSSILAWRIPWTEEPGGLQSLESQRFGHAWVANTHTHAQRPFLFPFLLYFWWRNGKESTCQCRRWKRRGFHSWIGKIPWRRERQPTPVVLLGKFREQRCLVGYSAVGCQDQGTTERRSTYTSTTTTGPWCPRVIGEGTWLQEIVLGKGTADPCQNWRLEVRSSQVQGRAWNAGGFSLLEPGDSFLSAGCSFLPPGLTASKTRETWLNAWMTDGSHVYNWAESVSSKKTQDGGKRNLEMRNKWRQRPRRERGFLRLILRAHVDWWLVGTSRWVLLFNLQKKVTKQELLLSPLYSPLSPSNCASSLGWWVKEPGIELHIVG